MGWRSILGLVAGVVAASLVIMALETVGHAVFPVSDDMTTVDALPMSMQLAVVGFYVVASFIGGGVAAWLGRTPLPAYGVAGVLLGLGIWNMMSIAHPTWMVVANCLALFVPALIGGWMVTKRHRPWPLRSSAL